MILNFCIKKNQFFVTIGESQKIDVKLQSNLYTEADLEGACGACAPPPPPLKFAKHMLYNVNQIVQQTSFA